MELYPPMMITHSKEAAVKESPETVVSILEVSNSLKLTFPIMIAMIIIMIS